MNAEADSIVLVVDDDVAFCSALSLALRRRGERVVVAHSVADALVEAEAWLPRRAVVDLRLGGESGIELIRLLLARLPELEIVLLTGYGSIRTAVEAVKAGAVQYLTKPASVEEILRAFDGEVGDEEEAPRPAKLDEVEWEHLQRVLGESGGNISEAARRLGMHRRSLQRKLARNR